MRILMVVCFAAGLLAQPKDTDAERKAAAVRAAVKGLGKRLVHQQPKQVLIAGPAERACSVPLLTVPVGDPGEFTVRTVPTGKTAPMPKVRVPAPPCETPAE